MISLSDVLLYKKAVAPQGAIYGLQYALFIASIPILIRREGRAWILMLAVALLFIASTIGLWANIGWIRHNINLKQRGQNWEPIGSVIHGWDRRYSGEEGRLLMAIRVASSTSYNINDGLVVWRAWVVWPQNRRARGLLVFCMACNLASTILEGIVGMHILLSSAFYFSFWLTNAVATSLIGVKLWFHRREVRRSFLAAGGTGSRVAAVLLLLLESGAVYCVLWVLDILSNTFYWDWTHKAWVGLPESLRIVDELFYLFAGIYPTFVVVVVALQQQKDAVRRTKGQGSFLESLCLVPDNGHVAQPAGGTYRPVGDFASTGSTETDSSDEIELEYRSREDGRGEVA